MQALQRLANATRQHKSQQDRDLQLAAAEVGLSLYLKRLHSVISTLHPYQEPPHLMTGCHDGKAACLVLILIYQEDCPST